MRLRLREKHRLVNCSLAILIILCASTATSFAQGASTVSDSSFESDNYEESLAKSINRHLFAPDIPVRKATIFEISLSKTGALVSLKKLKSCGQAKVDKSAELAITKSVPFPPMRKSVSQQDVRHYVVTVDPFGSLRLGKAVLVIEKKSQTIKNQTR